MCSRFWIDPTTGLHSIDLTDPWRRGPGTGAEATGFGSATQRAQAPNETAPPRRLWITPQFLDPLVIGSLPWLRPKTRRPARKSHAPLSDVRSASSPGVPRSTVQAWVRAQTPGQYGYPAWPQTSGWRTKVSLASRPCVT